MFSKKGYSFCIILNLLIASSFSQERNQILFKENKGQVCDQNYKSRKDILFYGNKEGLSFFLKQDGISYQFSRVDKWKKRGAVSKFHEDKIPELLPEQTTTYRLDLYWLNAEHYPEIVKKGEISGFENFYVESCPNGALGVKSYSRLVYKNIYPGIDLIWYSDNGRMKYDYECSPRSDFKKIQVKIEGAQSVSVNSSGQLEINTPLGKITEEKPIVKQNGKILEAEWKVAKNVASFEIRKLNPELPFQIDPLVRLWGTYYGGTDADEGEYCAVDVNDNVFLSGFTKSASAIATTGAHQQTYSGFLSYYGDAYIAKFNASGVRQWATYYGGAQDDYGSGCAIDANGNVYLTGGTSTTNSAVISTPSAFSNSCSGLPTSGWMADAFLVKFNSNGTRLWGTYFGGDYVDQGIGCTVDGNGNVIITGGTCSTVNIATAGCFQSAKVGIEDGYIAKFSSSGNRMWSTYYGGNGWTEGVVDCKTDAVNNIYISGYTQSTAGIASPGSFQSVFGGNDDAILIKMSPSGARIWATYYGGTGIESAQGLVVKGSNIYMTGSSGSASPNVIATAGSHQSGYGGGSSDGFLAVFDTSGARQWATYYGGNGKDNCYGVAVDASGNIYISGSSGSAGGTVIATPCTYQYNYGGGSSDAFLAKFDPNGARLWGTYYGDFASDYGYGCNTDSQNSIYLNGSVIANSGTVIASANGHQPNYGGGLSDAYLAKFDGCKPPVSLSPPQEICTGQSVTLTTNPGCGVLWYNAPGGVIIGNGSVVVISPPTTSTFYISDIGCGPATLTPVEMTVDPLPVITASASTTLICSGSSVILNAGGANNYTWTPGNINASSFTASPLSSINYSLTGFDGRCSNNASVSIVVVQTPSLFLNYNAQPHCFGSTLQINYGGASSYTWMPSAFIATNTGSSIISDSLFTPLNFTVYGSNSSGTLSCLDSRTAAIQVLSPVNPVISNSIIICKGAQGTLSVSGGNQWIWLPQANVNDFQASSVSVNPQSTTIFTVSASVNGVCPETATALVVVVPTPSVFAGLDTTITIGDPVFLRAEGNGIIKWMQGENMSCNECRVTSVFPLSSTCYTVELRDQFNCKATDDVCITVLNDFGIYVPNTFTPNDDGLNDLFKAQFYGIKDFTLNIYDRWGELIYSTSDFSSGWNGFYNGRPCQIGVYIYKLAYEPFVGKPGNKAGIVNLVR